jgi:hypothetical protein
MYHGNNGHLYDEIEPNYFEKITMTNKLLKHSLPLYVLV